MPRGSLQFRDRLLMEIEYQKDVIARMDPPNSEWDNGLMADIRQEKLELLTRLLSFYPEQRITPTVTRDPNA